MKKTALKRTRIRRVSDKRKRESAVYSRRKREYFKELARKQGRERGCAPFCEAFGPPHEAMDWHHVLPTGRGGKLNQHEDLMMAVSRAAHTWIHDNMKEAEKKGWLLKGPHQVAPEILEWTP